jgi:NADH-quinone oxidoreductase subunit F
MPEILVLMAHGGKPGQLNIDTYEANGGYSAIRKAIPGISPEDIVSLVKDSGLRGRGGAGFPTGMKWGFLPKDSPKPRYLVCNCDESEPGTFKDSWLIHHDPHQLIEGIILTSYAIKSNRAFIYCRGEFFKAINILRRAVNQAKAKGYLGNKILGSDFSLEIVVHPGAGAYIAGEETAQLNSLEGYRATPRLKPPFPAVSGLYNCPTIVNNVETLCNVVHIVNRGSAWFKSMGTEKSPGTKIYQISGQVQRPGCYEFSLGVTLDELIEVAGGMLPGRTFKACYPGGSSCSLLLDLNAQMCFEKLGDYNTALGTASIIVMDDSADMVKVAHRLMEFYQNESCGKCTPCREGTRWVVQILGRILAGGGKPSDLTVIDQVCRGMETNSFCPLAVGAAPPVLSAMKYFRSEFDSYIQKNKSNHLEMLIAYPYQ